MAIDDRPTIAAPDDDPYLWLEEVEGERALDFVDRQSRLTLEAFGGRQFATDRDTLAAIYDRSDNIPYVTRGGGLVYNLWKDAKNPRGVWRRTTLADFRNAEPGWETLLDIDRLATEEDKDWLLSWTQPLPGNSRVIVALSRGGSDAVTLREFDLDTKAFIADGFTLPEAKSGVEWIDADTLLLSSALGEGMATTSGYAKTVRLWRRGEPVERAPVLFEVPADRMAAYCSVDDTGPTPRMWFIDRIDFFNLNLWLGTEAGPRTKLDLPTDIWLEAHNDWLAVKLRGAWTVAGKTYAPDSVLGISLSAFLAGDRNFTIVFEPGPRRALQGFFWTAGKLVLSVLDELRPVFEICTPSASGWTRARLQGLPEIGVVDVWRLDRHEAESNGDLLANVQDPVTPPSLLLIEGVASPAILKQAPKTFSADGLIVTRHEAISVDGERIPYVQTGPAAETGDAPVYMSAYGGFGLAVKPHYNSALGKLWLERGGTTVQANIRGGGEFGTRWHDAGRYAGKRLAHDDFAAVAADLVKRGVTRAEQNCRRRRIERRHPDHQHAGALPRKIRRAVLHDSPDRHAPLHKAARGRELDRGIWRSRQARGVGLAEDLFRLSHRNTGPELPADPDRHHAPRRPRTSRPRPQDGGQAAGDGIRSLFLRAGGRRSRLRQGQPRARRVHRARLHIPEEQDRLGG